MIIRNTVWSIQFLQSWWNRVDRIEGMDQHVFDMIYNDLIHNHSHHHHHHSNHNYHNRNDDHVIKNDDKHTSRINKDHNDHHHHHHTMITIDDDPHIVMLDYDEINSHIPAFQYQKASSNFLHLAGMLMNTHLNCWMDE